MNLSLAQVHDAKTEIIYLLNLHHRIDYALARQAFLEVLQIKDTNTRNYYMTTILHALMASGPTAEVIAGMLDAAFSLDDYVPSNRPCMSLEKPVVTYVGSGKKGFKTVNLSSLAAFAASCNGLAVAKYCSPSTSSMTGSQDFIEIIGANANCSNDVMDETMRQIGVGFYRLEGVLPRFASIYNGLFMAPHALSFALAGMASFFQTDRLLYGLSHPNTALSLDVFRWYDVPSVTVASSTPDGIHYIDELTDAGVATVHSYGAVTDQAFLRRLPNLKQYTESRDSIATLSAISQEKNQIQNVIKGLAGLAGRNALLAKQIALNAALLTDVAFEGQDFAKSYNCSLDAIKSGEAISKLRQFVELTEGNVKTFDRLVIQAKEA